jgi:hypothetical protein
MLRALPEEPHTCYCAAEALPLTYGEYEARFMDPRHSGNAALFEKILHTREARSLLADFLPELLCVYAGGSRHRQFLARRFGSHLGRGLLQAGRREYPPFSQLFEDRGFLKDFTALFLALEDGFFEALDRAAATFESLPSGEKAEQAEELLRSMTGGRGGELVARGCRILNDIYRERPCFLTELLGPEFEKWIESVDFGEIRELFDHSANDIRTLAGRANEALWQYPAKVVILFSLAPALVNLLVDAADDAMLHVKDLPADLLTDVTVSLLRQIETAPVASLVNRLSEAIRKIHTGSALLGEPGAPELPRVLSEGIGEVVEQIDPVVFWKAKTAVSEIRASLGNAVADSAGRAPAMQRLSLLGGAEIANIRMKTRNRKLSCWEELDEEDFAESVIQGMDAYDLQEAAEVVNHLLRLFNRIIEFQPDFLKGRLGRFLDALDDYELAEAVRHFSEEDHTKAREAARAVVPSLVIHVCDILKPADDDHEDEARKARQALQALFAGGS